jgi:hypothetical protein
MACIQYVEILGTQYVAQHDFIEDRKQKQRERMQICFQTNLKSYDSMQGTRNDTHRNTINPTHESCQHLNTHYSSISQTT